MTGGRIYGVLRLLTRLVTCQIDLNLRLIKVLIYAIQFTLPSFPLSHAAPCHTHMHRHLTMASLLLQSLLCCVPFVELVYSSFQ